MKIRVLIVVAISFLLTSHFSSAAPASIYTVNSTLDLPDADLTDNACATQPPNSVCTLRAAVMQANAHAGLDFIALPAGTYKLTRVGYDSNAAYGDLDSTDDLTIYSTGGSVVINANGAVTFDRAFEVVAKSLNLSDLTIRNGNTPSYGGAIYSHGDLTLYNVSVQTNTAFLDGGGIYADNSNLRVSNSTLQGNTSQASGGGIAFAGASPNPPTLSIFDSTLANNRALGAGSSGGGAYAYTAKVLIQNSTFRNNLAGEGGALQYTAAVVGVRLDMTGTLIISNTASSVSGGGLYFYGNTSIVDSQIISNVAPSAGGLYAYFGTHVLNNVRITNNKATSYACGGIQVSSGNLYLTRGWVQYNTAPSLGGGLCTGGAGSIQMMITDTNILNNSVANGEGGGVFASNKFVALRSAIYNNFATRGGGVYAMGRAVIEDSTVSGNSAGRDGAGVYAAPDSNVQFNSATIASNHARTAGLFGGGTGGGIYISNTAVVSTANTLFDHNTNSDTAFSFSDCKGALVSQGYNFISTNEGCTITGDPTGNQIGGSSPFNLIDPKIDPLALVFGTTPAHLLHADSPLIDVGPPIGCQSALPIGFLFLDQIGHFRALDGNGDMVGLCDIGAVEYFDVKRVYLPLTRK
ncbi:MAG TPA: choice-of-anchor Q domain-containing protein [Anaerolineae bacterium]|nr:choice-of-anchor Q domain-containing protein [Anaerolineae bacterium]